MHGLYCQLSEVAESGGFGDDGEYEDNSRTHPKPLGVQGKKSEGKPAKNRSRITPARSLGLQIDPKKESYVRILSRNGAELYVHLLGEPGGRVGIPGLPERLLRKEPPMEVKKICRGRLCAVRLLLQQNGVTTYGWYRGKISEVYESREADIWLVDTGMLVPKVSVEKIKQLPIEHSFPPKAYICSIFGRKIQDAFVRLEQKSSDVISEGKAGGGFNLCEF